MADLSPWQLQTLAHCALGGIATFVEDHEGGLSLLDMGMVRCVGSTAAEDDEPLMMVVITMRELIAVDEARPALEIRADERSAQRLWLAGEIDNRVDDFPDSDDRVRIADNLRRRAETLRLMGR